MPRAPKFVPKRRRSPRLPSCPPTPPTPPPKEPLLRIAEALEAILAELKQPPTLPDAGLSVISVTGRMNMAPIIKHAPDLSLSSTETVTLSVSPTLPDGSAAPTPTWATSDPAALPIVPAADGLTCEVTTPNESGSGTVTVTSPGVRTSDIKITYTAPIEGEMNLSAGLPRQD